MILDENAINSWRQIVETFGIESKHIKGNTLLHFIETIEALRKEILMLKEQIAYLHIELDKE